VRRRGPDHEGGGRAVRDHVDGTVLPVLVIELDAGESVVSEAGEFSWMTGSVQLKTGTGGGLGGSGLLGAVKRAAGGSTFLFNTYSADKEPGTVAFATKLPGGIVPIDVGAAGEFVVHRHGFLAGTVGVQVGVALQQSFRGGIFGGEGFVLQRLSGQGRAWIELSGEIWSRELSEGEIIRVHPGHVGMFDSSVSFQVERVPGLTNRYLGSDGHHFVILSGPGRVWLQSMPIPLLAGAVAPYLPGDGGHPVEAGAMGGAMAGAIGNLLGKK
jgi:uncharacterized protein (TIGR00266 family)